MNLDFPIEIKLLVIKYDSVYFFSSFSRFSSISAYSSYIFSVAKASVSLSFSSNMYISTLFQLSKSILKFS